MTKIEGLVQARKKKRPAPDGPAPPGGPSDAGVGEFEEPDFQLFLTNTDSEASGDEEEVSGDEDEAAPRPTIWGAWGNHPIDVRKSNLKTAPDWEPSFRVPPGAPSLANSKELDFLLLCFPRNVQSVIVPATDLAKPELNFTEADFFNYMGCRLNMALYTGVEVKFFWSTVRHASAPLPYLGDIMSLKRF